MSCSCRRSVPGIKLMVWSTFGVVRILLVPLLSFRRVGGNKNLAYLVGPRAYECSYGSVNDYRTTMRIYHVNNSVWCGCANGDKKTLVYDGSYFEFVAGFCFGE